MSTQEIVSQLTDKNVNLIKSLKSNDSNIITNESKKQIIDLLEGNNAALYAMAKTIDAVSGDMKNIIKQV